MASEDQEASTNVMLDDGSSSEDGIFFMEPLPDHHHGKRSNSDLTDMTSSGIGSLNESDVDDEGDEESEGSESTATNTLAGSAVGDDIHIRVGDTTDEEESSESSHDSVVASSKKDRSFKIRHYSFGALTGPSQSPKARSADPKKVRFADSLGLDLVQIQTFDRAEEMKPHHSSTSPQQTQIVKKLVPIFSQPGSLPHFMQLVRERKVCLENAFMDNQSLSVRGVVRVLNMDYHKAVYIRWSMDDWRSLHDYRASYVTGSNDVVSDKFEFKIYSPLDFGQTLKFAVRYHCAGQQFWDNNDGQDYKFVCEKTETEVEDDWNRLF